MASAVTERSEGNPLWVDSIRKPSGVNSKLQGRGIRDPLPFREDPAVTDTQRSADGEP